MEGKEGTSAPAFATVQRLPALDKSLSVERSTDAFLAPAIISIPLPD
jgi:hypothetical protein